MLNPFFVLDRCYFRPLEPADAPLLAAMNNDPHVRHSFFTHTPTSLALQADRIKDLYKPGADYIPFAIVRKNEDDDAVIGITALVRVDLVSRAAVYMICITDRGSWGKGYATEVTAGMLRYAFDTLNLHRVQLHVWTGNTPAVHAYEKCGFRHEGVLREAMKHDNEWCDFHVMAVLEDEWRALNKGS